MTRRTGGFMDSRLFGIEQELAKVKKTEKQVWTTIASRDERLKPPESPVAAAPSLDLVSGSVCVEICTMHHTSHDDSSTPLRTSSLSLEEPLSNNNDIMIALCYRDSITAVGGGDDDE